MSRQKINDRQTKNKNANSDGGGKERSLFTVSVDINYQPKHLRRWAALEATFLVGSPTLFTSMPSSAWETKTRLTAATLHHRNSRHTTKTGVYDWSWFIVWVDEVLRKNCCWLWLKFWQLVWMSSSDNDFNTGCRNVSYNQQQSSSGLHQPGRSTNHKHWLAWVTANNSPSQDFTNPDDELTTNIDSPGSQPTTVLLRTSPTRTMNQIQTITHLGSDLSMCYRA